MDAVTRFKFNCIKQDLKDIFGDLFTISEERAEKISTEEINFFYGRFIKLRLIKN